MKNKHESHFTHKGDLMRNPKYLKLESIHCAIQELQMKYNIPEGDHDLDLAYKFTEDLREDYLT